jgi:hypothetical protein
MTGSSRDLASRLRSNAERCIHLIVRSPSGAEGFALFGGHRPRHYFSRVYLGAREHRVRLEIHGPSIIASCRKLLGDYGMVVFCGTMTPSDLSSEVLTTPGMVDLAIALPETLEGPRAGWSRSAQADINKVQRKGFRWDVQTGDSWVSEFHRRFHYPSMTERHAREACTISARGLADAARVKGAEFVRIVRDGKWVGGCLNRSTADAYRAHRMGWLGGDPQLLKDGVVSAIYWSTIRRAAELKHRSLKIGCAAPFLEDGLLFFKGKWGARLEPLSGTYGEFQLLLDPSHDTCRRFLTKHSLLAYGASGETVVYSARRPSEANVPSAILDGISRWYRWLGRPETSVTSTRAEVPAPLRAWVVEEELPDRASSGDLVTGLPAA